MRNAVDLSLFKRIETADGSYTLMLPNEAETYHSVKGARTESSYVFIEQGLQTVHKKEIFVCETGFGTGLNALLSYEYAHQFEIKIHYATCELYPISPEVLPPPRFIENNPFLCDAWQRIHLAHWNHEVKLSDLFSIVKMQQSLEDFLPKKKVNVWFHDAFSPKTQPEMWSVEVFSRLAQHMTTGACLVTYSSAGAVKQALKNAGFVIERLQGPPGKKHMLRAYWHNS
jgi:tRNA U34 5-methylaminomethyl-2-thiouridine-forming methyltransferase MnmC